MRNIIFTSIAMMIAGMATAQEGPDTGCYAREYSQSHMDQHPDQVVRSMWMYIKDEAFDGHVNRFAYLDVQFADQGHVQRNGGGAPRLTQVLICFGGEDGRTGCAVECDGGSFDVTKQTRTSMTIATDYLMVGETDGCGGAIDLSEKQGQKVKYRLNKVDPIMCSGLGN